MSANSSSGAPLGLGVVKNSALSFVASAQCAQNETLQDNNPEIDNEQLTPTIPAGLKTLYDECSKLYPDQPNPLQVTTRLKYWLGGHDPLDYISMYWNPGKPEEHIPAHWHYISFGLSDLHGDGRVHPLPDLSPRLSASPSGYGLELTFRLAAEAGAPPLWPAALLHALARYIFTTGNKFYAGDHISWHNPLDGSASHSRIRHLLVADDPQLPTVNTAHGTVSFLQIVGCTGRELKAAQRGSGFDVLKLMAEDPNCGGAWHVTRMRRRASSRHVSRHRRVAGAGLGAAPLAGAGPGAAPLAGAGPGAAPLAGVTARLRFTSWGSTEDLTPVSPLPETVEQQIKDTLQRGLTSMSSQRSGPEGHMSTDSFEMSSIERALPHVPELMQGSWRNEDTVEYYDGVHLVLNPEGASLLPLAIDARVLHGRHFTWRDSGRTVTVLPPTVAGAFATPQRPYAAKGDWLQIIIPNELARDMSKQVAALSRLTDTDSESGSEQEEDIKPPSVPHIMTWNKYRLKISIVPDTDFL